jgi:hypothetical protein
MSSATLEHVMSTGGCKPCPTRLYPWFASGTVVFDIACSSSTDFHPFPYAEQTNPWNPKSQTLPMGTASSHAIITTEYYYYARLQGGRIKIIILGVGS